jgi:hypothetical protein
MSRRGQKKSVASVIMRVCSMQGKEGALHVAAALRLRGQRRPTWLRPFCPSYSTPVSSYTWAFWATSPCTERTRITNDLILDKVLAKSILVRYQVDVVAGPSDCSVQQLRA